MCVPKQYNLPSFFLPPEKKHKSRAKGNMRFDTKAQVENTGHVKALYINTYGNDLKN